jgi:hypothetical protein
MLRGDRRPPNTKEQQERERERPSKTAKGPHPVKGEVNDKYSN